MTLFRPTGTCSAAEARLAFLMPPPEGSRPPEGEPSPDGREVPRFSLENTEGATKDAVDRANVDSVQARNKQLNDAYSRFQLGINRFKEGYEKNIKQAEADGDPEAAAKLRDQMNKTIDEQVALANQRLLTLHNEQGYPLYQVGRTPDGRITFNRQTGAAAPENLNKSISNLSPRMQNAIRRLPPDRARMMAETFSGMSAADLRAIEAPATALIEQVGNLSPEARNAVYLWLLNPASVPNNPQALVKQLRMSEAEARDALSVIESLQKSDPRILAMFRRSASFQERYNSAGGGAQGEAIRSIPENNPARTAEILSAIGAPPLNPTQITNIRVGLANYIEKVGAPGATDAVRDMERGNLMMMGVNPDAKIDGFQSLDQVCDRMRGGGRVEGRLAVRTVSPRELQGMQLAGALTYLLGFINKLGKGDKPLSGPSTAAERQKRIEEINRRVGAIDQEITKLNGELNGSPRPNEARQKEITEQIRKLNEERAKLIAERDRLQKEGNTPPLNPAEDRQKRIEGIDKRLAQVDGRLKVINAELSATPAPTEARAKELNQEKAKLEKERKQLVEDREKLVKEGGGPGGPGGPTEGPRRPHTPDSRKILKDASETSFKAYANAVASGTDAGLVVRTNQEAQAKLGDELAHLQEYANPDSVDPGRVADLQKSLTDLRTNALPQQFQKIQADITRAEAMPDPPPAERAVPKLDAKIAAYRARLSLLRNGPRDAATDKIVNDAEEQLQKAVRERTVLNAGAVDHSETRGNALRKETEDADKNRTALMRSRTGPDRGNAAILQAFDATIAKAETELAFYSEQASPDAARVTALRTLLRNLNSSDRDPAPPAPPQNCGKLQETGYQLRDASDRAAALPDTDRGAKLDAMIQANVAELAHLQTIPGSDGVRIAALQKAIPEYRRERAVLRPVTT